MTKFPGSDKDGDFDDKSTMTTKEKKKSTLSKMYKNHPKGCDCSDCKEKS